MFALEAGTGDLVGKDGHGSDPGIHITGASLTNAATGEVSYTYSTTLSQPVKHASLDGQAGDNSENSALLSGVTFEVTDKDTDTTQGTFSVTIVDDVPSIDAPGASPTLTVDETNLRRTRIRRTLRARSRPRIGADGAGTTTYALNVVAGPSGLTDTATNEAVNLVLNGTTVEGRTATTDLLVFTVDGGRRRQRDAGSAPGGGAHAEQRIRTSRRRCRRTIW